MIDYGINTMFSLPVGVYCPYPPPPSYILRPMYGPGIVLERLGCGSNNFKPCELGSRTAYWKQKLEKFKMVARQGQHVHAVRFIETIKQNMSVISDYICISQVGFFLEPKNAYSILRSFSSSSSSDIFSTRLRRLTSGWYF